MTEEQLQHECYMWFVKAYPEQKGMLYMNYNNPPNGRKGAQLLGMGLVAGVADLTYLTPKGHAVFIEIKTEKGRLSNVQKALSLKFKDAGFAYTVIRDIEAFQLFINNLNKHT